MSEELKTLKDIEKVSEESDLGNEFYEVSSDDLRQLTIKWIKADIKIAQKQESGVDTKMLIACMKWANRFNITKEDLKS